MKTLSVIILNYNTKDLTLDCIESILSKESRHDIEVVVVDNGSNDGSVEAIRAKYSQVKVYETGKNLGFSKGNNLGLKKVYKNSKYCLLLNSDTLVLDGSIDNLIDFISKSDYSIVSCKLLNSDKSFQPNAGYLPTLFPVFIWLSGMDDIFRKLIHLPSYQERGKGYYKNNVDVGWVSGSVMLIKSTLIDKIGLLDEKIFMYAEDVDYCWRVEKKGEKIGWTDKSEIIHIGGASSKEPQYKQWLGEFRSLIYLYDKYYGCLGKVLLKILMYIFIFIRVIVFGLVGKSEHAKTYAKILKEL